MSTDIDGVLVQWGDRLFYPANRIVNGRTPRLSALGSRQRAAEIRERIAATVVRRAPQVMVKVTGGGRGIKAIAAHLRYMSKNGRLEFEDERGQTTRGKEGLRELADDWRFGGSLIGDTSDRREAFNLMLSMPRGTDPVSVQWAAREFARAELAGHKYVMVLHDHQANPHVHLSVRAESMQGRRLNPRKTDLHRWRETFATKLRERGIEAEATRQATRDVTRRYPALWQVEAAKGGRLLKTPVARSAGVESSANRDDAKDAWRRIAALLASSGNDADRKLAESIGQFVAGTPVNRRAELQQGRATPLAPTPGGMVR